MRPTYPSMTPDSESTIEIFTEALNLPVEERAAFLDRACAGNEVLRRKIEALLKSNDRTEGFLEKPAAVEIDVERTKIFVGEKPGDQVDRYRLAQQIGEGGCGVVFIAEQEQPVRRRVALKVVKPGMDTKSVIARFEAERQALALMDHPNIAHVFDAGTTEAGRPYFVMELVEGIKISDFCRRYSLPLKQRLELFIQVCDAIQHAHQKGIIHRDIKPSNILVAMGSDGKPVPKVIDFGIAKATIGHLLTDKTILTAHELLIGTPAYMSPEQAALTSTEVDTRTDIYSLGVLLYELLTGTTPFDTQELLKAGFDEIRRVVREEEPVRPSTRLTTMGAADLVSASKHYGAEAPKLIREMRGDLDWIVMKALEKDRARRYATANGLAMDVERYLTGEAILARPPSRVYKFRKLAARNKLVVSACAITFVLLVVSLITTTRWLMTEKRTQERMRQQMELVELDSQALELVYQNKYAEAAQMVRKALDMHRQFPQAEYASQIRRQTTLLQILIRSGEFDEIKPLFDSYVDTSLLSSRLEVRAMFETATLELAKHGKWNDAAYLGSELFKSQPTNHAYFHILVPIMVARNDAENYRRLCGGMMSLFGSTTDFHIADRTAKDCLILPSSGVDLNAVLALLEFAINRGKDSSAAPYIQSCKALAEFRLSHYEEAKKWAQLASQGVFPDVKAQAAAIIAMSQFKLNQLAQAQTTLANCNSVIQTRMPALEKGLGESWRDWIIAQALQSEAQGMIGGRPPSPAPEANTPH